MQKNKEKIVSIVVILVFLIAGLVFLQLNIIKNKKVDNKKPLSVELYSEYKQKQVKEEKSIESASKSRNEQIQTTTIKIEKEKTPTSPPAKTTNPTKPKTYYPPYVLTNSATGGKTSSSGASILDYSNANSGYVMLNYNGSNPKVKTLIKNSRSGLKRHQFITRKRGSYEAFPLSQGSGEYSVIVYENISGDTYTPIISKNVSASIANASPFIRPNQIVSYYSGTNAVKYAAELTRGTSNDTQKVNAIYGYVVKNIKYDHGKAASVQSGYIPSVSATFNSKRGICFDYAALMAAMCRSQRIPCRVVAGATPQGQHAWVEVYYNGGWKRMDPTFASEGTPSSYINNSNNYHSQFYY
ncbi:MAG: transglutaminase-like domain-containing protein [Clostridia bacterium]|nr:transglutaminase-like domain-containing protein [Clostridia bacterium]